MHSSVSLHKRSAVAFGDRSETSIEIEKDPDGQVDTGSGTKLGTNAVRLDEGHLAVLGQRAQASALPGGPVQFAASEVGAGTAAAARTSDADNVTIHCTPAQLDQLVAGANDALIAGAEDVRNRSVSGLEPEEALYVHRNVDQIGDEVEMACRGETGPANPDLGPAARLVRRRIEQSLQRAGARTGGPLTPEQRYVAIIEALGHVQHESASGIAKRQGKNLLWVALRTGTIVHTMTVLRQKSGFNIEQMLINGAVSPAARAWMSTGIGFWVLGLNLAGFLRDRHRGTATARSSSARRQMMALTLLAMIATRLTGTAGALTSFASQAVIYCLLRDLAQLFFPLRTNVEETSAAAIRDAQTAYGLNQFGVGTLMDWLGPDSGPGAAIRNPGGASNTRHDNGRGVPNAAGETTDDLLGANLARWEEVRQNRDDIAVHAPKALDRLCKVLLAAEEEGVEKGLEGEALFEFVKEKTKGEIDTMTAGLKVWVEARWPTMNQALDQLLTTSAMRHGAFYASFAFGTMADELVQLVPDQLKAILMNMISGGSLFTSYGAFAEAHQTQPPRHEREAAAERERERERERDGGEPRHSTVAVPEDIEMTEMLRMNEPMLRQRQH